MQEDSETREDGENGNKEEMRIPDGGEAPQEGQAPKVLRDPGQPTARQREIHECIHIPFRAWCRECVLGRGRQY